MWNLKNNDANKVICKTEIDLQTLKTSLWLLKGKDWGFTDKRFEARLHSSLVKSRELKLRAPHLYNNTRNCLACHSGLQEEWVRHCAWITSALWGAIWWKKRIEAFQDILSPVYPFVSARYRLKGRMLKCDKDSERSFPINSETF